VAEDVHLRPQTGRMPPPDKSHFLGKRSDF
jgi:hypothetical protein